MKNFNRCKKERAATRGSFDAKEDEALRNSKSP
jgi:hypothetical protein